MARRQKSLSDKDRRRIEAHKEAQRKRRAEAEWRDYDRRVIQPIYDGVDALWEDDVRFYGPVQPGSTAAARQLLDSWRDAARDLDLVVERLGFSVAVRNFGRPQGMLCAVLNVPTGVRELQDHADTHEMAWAVLSESYLHYDRQLFIDTLNDWGWCSKGSPPQWYSGKPWTT